MSFEVVEPSKFVYTVGLGEGECSTGKSGIGTFRAADLALIGIKGESPTAVVLVDIETWRIAVRAARADDAGKTVRVSIVKRGEVDSGRRRINLARAIKCLDLTCKAVAGRYTLNVHKDELLILNLMEARGTSGDKKPGTG